MSDAADIDQQAELARQLLENPLLAQVLAELDTDAIRAWRSSANPEQREAVYHEMMAVQRLAARLRQRLETKQLRDARGPRTQR